MIEEDDFRAFALTADQPIDRAGKEQVVDVAPVLSINIGYYQDKYDEVPREGLLHRIGVGRSKSALGKRGFIRVCRGTRTCRHFRCL